MKKFIFLLTVILSAAAAFCADDDKKSLLEYLSEGKKALDEEYFDKAIGIFNAAEAAYPESYLPNSYKGDLYKKYDLYKSAIKEYEKALQKQTTSITLYDDLAECYSNQGDEEKAIAIYKEALLNVYNSSDLYNSLAWSYIKTNRTDESLATLKEALAKYPESSDLLVTLGSAYYSADDYENAKKAYLSAEYHSFRQGKSGVFRAIVKYNQASLEHSFGHYEDALQTADAANAYSQRSSAHILLAEMYFNMLDLRRSLSEINQASQLQPVTLYPNQLLTRICIITNQTERAQTLINDLENNSDHKWLTSFSTSLDDYYANVCSLAAELYQTKSVLTYAEYDNRFVGLYHKIGFALKSFIYKVRYANLCLKTGRRQLDGGSIISGLENVYEAYAQFDILSGKALKVLNILAEKETQTRPFTLPKYNTLRSNLRQKSSVFYTKKANVQVIRDNLKNVNPKWEKVQIADALIYLADASKGAQKAAYVSKLFMLCPWAVAGHGYTLECRLVFDDDMPQAAQQALVKHLKRYKIKQNDKASLQLSVRFAGDGITISAADADNNHRVFTKSFDESKNQAKQIWECIFVM